MVTLTRDTAGRYFVSMAIQEVIQPKPTTAGAMGIDLGTLTP